MERIIFRLVVLTSAGCLSAKHVYVEEQLSWSAAREYCRNNYTDLSRLSTKQEEDLFMKFVDPNDRGWIGVYWNQTTDTWRWSGGENVTFWDSLYSDDEDHNELQEPYPIENNVYWTRYKWQSKDGKDNKNFFCLSLTVVQEEKTWEEALEHCTQNQANFTSLLSDNETLLATNELNQTSATDPVWIGLRYLGDEWLWVNGEPLDYENWSPGAQDHQCPAKDHCGALTMQGVWENRDCEEKLSFICG